MATLLSSILQSVGAKVDQDTTLPSSTELVVRVNYADQAQNDWADAYEWRILKQSFAPTVLLSMTSIGLPARFRRFTSPLYDKSITSSNDYWEISPDDRFTKLSTDRYFYTGGDDATGRYLMINPALSSGVSLVGQFLSFPSALATTSDAVTCPSNKYMTERISFYVLEARSDARFPTVEGRSEQILANLIEEENTPRGSEDNRVPDFARSSNFRIGRD